ncbi:hypothetical protein OO184_21780 [Photorhabdus sp. APURE]|uniref:hypothetical protein n=1 Tax=Photorhabdus aballayi TaxID=2991723 RepID=UPI00223E4540|nr:hypothetical protein [Photorhabdus aballayi]MCW7550488.1 hypothetical protein [Photorhabdus aballayi]
MDNKFLSLLLVTLFFFSSFSIGAIQETRMINFENKISLPKSTEEQLYKLGNELYSASVDKLYSAKYWGKYGTFSKVGIEVQGSLAYGMALAGPSDLDIAFVYKYNNGDSMHTLSPVKLKDDAVNAFKEVFGSKYNYTIKIPVVNLSNSTEDIDIAFFNVLNKSAPLCSIDKRCSELNYGKDDATSEWYRSERLSLYSELDNVFSKKTPKREIINRSGKILKVWREKIFSDQEVKIPSIALVTMIYDFSKDNGAKYNYNKSTDTLRDVTSYSIIKYFKNDKCEGAPNAKIDLPVYQQDRNLLSKLNSSQRINTCLKLVEFNKALIRATSAQVSEAESVKILEPFIGRF